MKRARNRKHMNNRRVASLKSAAGLGVLSAIGLLLLGAAPAFAWHATTLGTTVSSPTATVGSGVFDKAMIQLTNNGGNLGSITFRLYSGGCTNGVPTGTLKFTSTVAVTSAAEASGGATYQSGTFTTT